MTDLTEQWKKGELPYAEYYIKLAGGEYTNDVWDIDGWQSFNKKGDVVVEVLAPVPSYEEWKALNGNMDSVMQTNQALCKKLAELKELLKECELWFTGVVGNMKDKNVGEHNKSVPVGNFEYIFKEFSQKINEVLK